MAVPSSEETTINLAPKSSEDEIDNDELTSLKGLSLNNNDPVSRATQRQSSICPVPMAGGSAHGSNNNRKSIAGANQNKGEGYAVVDKSCCCASCGIAEIDDIKLKECDGCDLVRYCSDECQKSHKSEHEVACKKRAAELRDELLFKQPESTHMGDCPICSLPLSLDMSKCSIYPCCSKIICDGCNYANQWRQFEQRLVQLCPFCRKSLPSTQEDFDQQRMKRIEMNDPAAMCYEGVEQRKKGNYSRAFHYWKKAAELGDVEAHYRMAGMYQNGYGVEQDEGKMIHHAEEAAIGGHPIARYNLGCHENDNGNIERAVKHWYISATHGHDLSTKALMKAFQHGFLEKEVLAAAFRAHKAAVDAVKSPQREEAEVLSSNYHRKF